MHLQPKRGKRPTADLNLVPYIDLLTCMVAFLLITAVWTQLARLQVAQRQPGLIGDSFDPPPKEVAVLVTDEGFNVRVGEDGTIVPRRDRGYDFAALKSALDRAKAQLPDQKQLRVSSEDHIPYDTLVATMDTAIAAGFPDLSLVDAGAGRL